MDDAALSLKEPFSKVVDGKRTDMGRWGYGDFNFPKSTKGKGTHKYPCISSLLMGGVRTECTNFFNTRGYVENHCTGKTHPPLPDAVVTFYKLEGVPKEER